MVLPKVIDSVSRCVLTKLYTTLVECFIDARSLSIYLPIYQPTYLSTYLSIYQLTYLSTYLPTYIYLPTYFSIYLHINLSISLSTSIFPKFATFLLLGMFDEENNV